MSCDSFNEETNRAIGRGTGDNAEGKASHVESMRKVRDLCLKYGPHFKMNTVVNSKNVDEDMTEMLRELQPRRWKVFQCLLIDGENQGPKALRNAETFVVSDAAFAAFIARHESVHPVAEPNDLMRNSYLILDEQMRFLNCTEGDKLPTKSILDVGVADALKGAGFDEGAFRKRGGRFKWSRDKAPHGVPEW